MAASVRYLGIPTLRDRVAQMALKLILEPIFEVDFYPSSYGYRPGRRAHDAIAEIHHFTKGRSQYEWVIEGDIKARFDNVDHQVCSSALWPSESQTAKCCGWSAPFFGPALSNNTVALRRA
jgi:retron-type reverse transcriptase